MIDRNIVVTGFMGTGKTTVGRVIASRLNRPFVDTDDEIARRAGKPVARIFAEEGEGYFRYCERRLCRFLAAQRGLVVATGGGMLVDESNRRVMLASGLVICLNAPPEVISRRLEQTSDERPLLRGNWQTLLDQRAAAYAAIPHQVDTTGKTPEQIADEIIGLWQTLSG